MEATEGGAFTAYSTNATSSGVNEWNTGTSDTDQVIFNPTANAINFSGTTSIAAGQLGLIPGTSGAYSVVRWTAPAAGVYTVSGTFSGLDTTPTDSDVHVLSDNLPIFNSTVTTSGTGSNTTATETISLPTGGTIDFLVGSNSNAAAAATDATGLTASVTSVPNSPINAQQGFWANSLAADDDGSTGAVPLGFTLNFFGQQYSSVYVNNNGNVTFTTSLGEYTAGALNSVSTPIIAPYWADVDTIVGPIVNYGTGTVDGHPAFGVEWPGVGYYSDSIDKLNTFELILIDRSDTGAGNFDIEFNYAQIQWETGEASGGSDGLGGDSARVGYSNGTTDAGTFFELPGSAVNGAFLDGNTTTGLINSSVNSGGVLGRYVFEARSGTVISSSAAATLNAATVTTVAPSYEFSVTYSGSTPINIGSFGSHNVLVTGPDNFSEDATYVGVDTHSNGTPRTATYKIAEPTAGLENGGTYTVALQANQVKDTSGHFLTAGPIGTFSVNLVTASATLAAPADFVPAAKLYDFDVTYVDPFGISVSTLDNHDITVTGPNGYSQAAKKVSASSSQNSSSVTVTYSIQAPTAAGWGAADAGIYTFTLNSNQVANIRHTFITGSVLGTPTLQTIGNLSIAPAGALPYVSDIAIATDSSGNAHIAYIDSLSGVIEYITYSASGHFSPLQIVDPAPGNAQDIAIAVGGSTSYVAYFDSTAGELKLAVNSGSGWHISVVDPATDVGENPSLAFNAQGQLVISYFDDVNDALKLAVRNGTHFTISTVDNSSGVGLFSSIALNPHTHELGIAYQDATNGDLKLATQSGSSFSTAAIPNTDASGQQISLAFTRSGLATLAYYDVAGNSSDVIQFNSGAWGSVATFGTAGPDSTVSGTQLLLTPGATQTADDVFVDNGATALNLGTTASGVSSTTIFSEAGPIAASAMTPSGAIDMLTQPTGETYALLLVQPAPAPVKAGASKTFNETIPGLAEIYGGGDAGLPDSGGQAPVTITLPANPTVVTFTTVSGTISLNSQGGFNNPDGDVTSGSYGVSSSSTTAYGGLSGISAPDEGELVGAFVSNAGPSGTAPASLDFITTGTNFTTLSPLLNQVFYIGDGKTGDQTGAIQQFDVPAGATKLLLGIPDAEGYNGTPGSYSDNSGDFTATLEVKTGAATTGGPLAFKVVGVDKKISYVQSSTAAPTTPSVDLSGDPGTYDMNATFDTESFPSPAISSATVTTPGSSSLSLNSADSFASDNWYGSQSALDTAYPDGSYSVAVTTNTAGVKTFNLSLTGDSYPTAPDITNFTALQSANVAQPIPVTWAPFTGGVSGDVIQLRVLSTAGAVVYETPLVDAGHLDGTATGTTIPAHTLTAGQTYIGEVAFYKVITSNTTTYPGARVGSGYGAVTQFYINLAAPNASIAGTFDEVADSVFNDTGSLQLSLSGNVISGTATQSGTLEGTVTGTITGSSFVIYYTNTTTDIGFTFTYTGTISSDGTTLLGVYKNSDGVTDPALTFVRGM